MNDIKTLTAAGLWHDNPALVQLLGLCPLLAVTTTLVNGLALGLATIAVLTATNTIVSVIRHALVATVRIPVFVLIIASFVTTVDLLGSAYFHDLHEILGLFIPLIITNCAILAQAETVASRTSIGPAAASGFAAGLGFTSVLVALGALRELVGQGSVLAGFDMLVGDGALDLTLRLPFDGMLAAILPPGAFFGLACLLALRNYLTRGAEPATSTRSPAVEGARP